MKKFLVFGILALAVVSCGKTKETVEVTPTNLSEKEQQLALGKKIFDGKGACASCHLPERKAIGPSIKEIAEIYRAQNGDMKAFLLEKAEPIVDPTQYVTMKTNFVITKRLPENELEAVIAYMESF
ncbi:c-type cytochrome [Flavobacterium agricola]|uniref:C-type cytochrome n=1 Tax=Flavobacterium agricola TaxID=2870839 RepID=A0ABY6LX79_9FLAO|nr:c-type cytochrome [Flavobacterium agricola]UYW00934.1 c-type cytochrome [Flavobacterium agricola]